MINLNELFKKCIRAEEVIRVDPEYTNDIYVGNNNLLQKTLVVRGRSKQRKVTSSKNISAVIGIKDENLVTLSFSLQEEKYSSAFYKFCEDIIVNSKNIEKDRIVVHTINRWNIWRSMFEKSNSSELNESQLKGLIGELLFLKYYLIDKYGAEGAINSWTGPECNPKDFYTRDKWYEIKTINESRQSVEVSSIEQLDSEEDGYIVVNKVQKVSREAKNSISLNSLVFDIAKGIQDSSMLEIFNQKLGLVGYRFNEEYDDNCYIHKKAAFYEVNSTFPVLRRNVIPKDILKISYELSLTNLIEERVEKWIY